MNRSDFVNQRINDRKLSLEKRDPMFEIQDELFGEEEIMLNINSTPLGQLLGIIASLPEIRYEKVINVRKKIDCGHYEANENLDAALDAVLEELISEG